ncbi:GBF-interacting protein 1-like isoform X2 [Raphanus sativus]|uniref:GBF-interacting protein 1-like isoform X2 n=1 Tax=Raphanus sativus TaxID=3726 RepID=A0A9W3BSB1_RAPSA|nr:GBF-interacting protein 1-like isoform X2 [Raphanus sativus]
MRWCQGSSDGASSAVESSKNRVALGFNEEHTEQKSVGSKPLSRPSSSEVRSTSSNSKSVSEQHLGQSKSQNRSRGVGKTSVNDAYVQRPASSHSNSTGSRPSSNYSNRSHQTVGPQRGKEWKPKPVNQNTTQGSGASATSEALAVPTEASEKSVKDVPSADGTSRLQRQLEDLQVQRQHVIIPNHILVPEAERTKFSFGSFDAGFSITSSSVVFPENEKRSAPLSQNSQEVEDSLEEEELSKPNIHSTEKDDEDNVYSESPSQVPNDMAGEGINATDAAPVYDVSKQENMLESESNQNPFDHVPSNIIGTVPPAPGSQHPQFENADPQARDALRIPNFVVPQPFDTASYYAQFYRSGPDSDGRVSPFVSPGVASKFNGNVTVLPPHSSQTMQEGGNNLVLSTASPTPLVTQPAGLMQNSIPVTQQPVPFLRPPGLHMSHYPPNYMPYGHYFSPFYLPHPAMQQFLSNGTFAQQPQASSVYPAAPPPPGAATGGKYTLPHYKPGNNTNHVGMPGGYGPSHGSFPAGYNPNSAASAGNSTSNEDLSTLQLKENNGYSTTGQQSEALPVWIAGPGRDMPSPFYGLQHHGQHVTYAPAQAGHVAFPGMYHPGQAAVTAAGVHHPLLQQSQGVTGADMVAPGPNVFQQPQQTPMNWPSNY